MRRKTIEDQSEIQNYSYNKGVFLEGTNGLIKSKGMTKENVVDKKGEYIKVSK